VGLEVVDGVAHGGSVQATPESEYAEVAEITRRSRRSRRGRGGCMGSWNRNLSPGPALRPPRLLRDLCVLRIRGKSRIVMA
jgi:hypothetical protein